MAVGTQYRRELANSSRGTRGTIWTTPAGGTGISGTRVEVFGDLLGTMWGDLPVAKGAYAAYESIWKQLTLDPAPSGSLFNQAANFTATGTLVVTDILIKGVVANMTATGTLAVQKWIAKGVSFTATGTLTRQRLISVFKGFSATATLAVTAGRLLNVVANMTATGTLAVSKRLSLGVSKAFSAIGTLVTAETFIPGAVGPAILAEQVRRFFRYLGRRW
jgi:hypothetical protein